MACARQAPAAAPGAAAKSDSGGRPATRSSTMFGRSLAASLAAATAKDGAPTLAAAPDAAPLARTAGGSVSSSFARKVRGLCGGDSSHGCLTSRLLNRGMHASLGAMLSSWVSLLLALVVLLSRGRRGLKAPATCLPIQKG